MDTVVNQCTLIVSQVAHPGSRIKWPLSLRLHVHSLSSPTIRNMRTSIPSPLLTIYLTASSRRYRDKNGVVRFFFETSPQAAPSDRLLGTTQATIGRPYQVSSPRPEP